MPTQSEPHFTVLVRLPFPRGDFVDPPPVKWNASKDRELWEVLSQPSKEDDIDCREISVTHPSNRTFTKQTSRTNLTRLSATHLDVSLPFLLQQAAWLYDRQLAQVRAQVRKVGNQQSAPTSPSPLPSSASMSGSHAAAAAAAAAPSGTPMNRAGSSGSAAPTRLSMRERRETQKQDSSTPQTPIKPKELTEQKSAPRSQSPRTWQAQHRSSTKEGPAPEDDSSLSRWKGQKAPSSQAMEGESSDVDSSSSSSSDSESEDTDEPGMALRRFGRQSVHRSGRSKSDVVANDDDGEEDELPAFLPPSNPNDKATAPSESDLRATMRQLREPQPDQRAQVEKANVPPSTEPSETSSSSGMAASFQRNERANSHPTRHPDALRPQRQAQAPHANSRRHSGRATTSEDAHSMGSSFSDLEDTSVTQSALEEALLSNMQHGTIGSRMSTISQALRSKYLT